VARATSGDELQAEVDLFLAHLGDRFDDVAGDLIDPADMLATLRLFGLYDVGRTSTGEPLDVRRAAWRPPASSPAKTGQAEKLLEGERRAQDDG
jgi:hypothetical protein